MFNPGAYDITICQGATFELSLECEDSNGAPLNMTGYTVSGTLWNRTGTSKLATFDTSWTVQASGMLKLRLPESVTRNITEQGQYDVLVTMPNDDTFYMLEGNAFWNQGMTIRQGL